MKMFDDKYPGSQGEQAGKEDLFVSSLFVIYFLYCFLDFLGFLIRRQNLYTSVILQIE